MACQRSVDGSGGGGSEVDLELREGYFDGVQVGAVGRQEQHPGAFASDSPLSGFALVARQIVENDDIARLESGQQLGFDIGVENRAVHRCVGNPWRDQSIALVQLDPFQEITEVNWDLRALLVIDYTRYAAGASDRQRDHGCRYILGWHLCS
jgi:hypothetical protein